MIESPIDCVCVIHGDKYDWTYVEKLYSMVVSCASRPINFHVFTEASRSVPAPMIKHALAEWPGVSGPRKSWWYKMQVFDSARISGQILYFDLDVVIVGDLGWIFNLDPQYFWIIRDWRCLWKPLSQGLNSSVMYWDNSKFSKIWHDFNDQGIQDVISRYRGDQDFIGAVLPQTETRYFQDELILSWRWQVKDGGFDPRTKSYKYPGQGSILSQDARILVFHGHPKPHEIQDPIVEKFWILKKP